MPACLPSSPPSAPTDPPSAVVSVVLADDSPAYARPLVRRMEADPAWDLLLAVGTGEDAVEAVRRLRPDLVVLDVRMPGMGGIAAARILREDPDLPGLRVVLMTGDVTSDLLAPPAEVPADVVVDKALPRREILARLLAAAADGTGADGEPGARSG